MSFGVKRIVLAKKLRPAGLFRDRPVEVLRGNTAWIWGFLICGVSFLVYFRFLGLFHSKLDELRITKFGITFSFGAALKWSPVVIALTGVVQFFEHALVRARRIRFSTGIAGWFCFGFAAYIVIAFMGFIFS